MLVFEWNFLGLSSETKPLNDEKVINGSTFYECDTSNFFIYYNGEWYKQTFVTEDGINVYLYKLLMRKMFKNAFDTNISKTHIYNPEISSNISFTSVLPSNITEMEMYGDTYQQTYSGKNLLPPPEDFIQDVNGLIITCSNGEYTINGNASSGTTTALKSTIAEYTIQTDDYFHYNNDLVSSRINIGLRFSDNTQFATSMNEGNRIISLEDYVGKTVVGVNVNFNSGYDFSGTAKPMILNGVSTVTPFEPYVGGIPAPNPEYPQSVKTVTGEQTVTINGEQIYTIDLDSTELCKLGDYQDYIYKSGDDWYVHKEVGKYIFDGTETWTTGAYGVNSWYLRNVLNFPYDTSKVQIFSNLFRGISNDDRNTAGSNTIYTSDANTFWIRNTLLTTLGQVQSVTNGNYIYYALTTPTDTKITDTELISSLNSIMSYTFPTGLNYITVSASNLPALLKLTITEKE